MGLVGKGWGNIQCKEMVDHADLVKSNVTRAVRLFGRRRALLSTILAFELVVALFAVSEPCRCFSLWFLGRNYAIR